ncbi:hypothetical protein Fot_19307 [Forsythia ovata]|uniref:Uncharacterized protein n=1 Tax=Forsythia ovata TaxID=205694 RepID=A0ABD1VKN5_9LAMI
MQEDDLIDSDLHFIKLNVNDISKSYEWSNAIKNKSRNSVDKIKERKSISEGKKKQETKHLRNKIFRWHRMGIHQYTRRIRRVRLERIVRGLTPLMPLGIVQHERVCISSPLMPLSIIRTFHFFTDVLS